MRVHFLAASMLAAVTASWAADDPKALPKKAEVGKEFTFDLAAAMKVKGAVAFVGMKGPAGLKLTLDGKITWTPAKGQAGTHELKLQFSGGGKSEFQTYKIMVEGGPAEKAPPGDKTPDKPDPKDPVKGGPALRDGETLSTTAAAGRPYSFDLAPPGSKAVYRALFGPKGLRLAPDGKVSWTPEKGMVGPHDLKVEIRIGPKQEFHTYRIMVDGNPGRKIATFPLGPPSGWVMTPDNVTLIVSQPEKAQLVYFDTVADKEVKRVELDFQPSSLALQGKTLYAAARGSSVVHELDADTGKEKKEYALGDDAVAHLACHPTKGPVFASTTKFTVHAIDPVAGKVTATDAKGFFLAVDPAVAFLYTGIQPQRKTEYIWKEDAAGRVTILWDRWGTRGMLLKYAIKGLDLKKVSAQNNAAVNGWAMHLTPDGKRLMLVGGGGWRPKEDGAGGGYVIAMYSTTNLEARVGEAPHGLSVAFHPVLNLGVTNVYGKELTLFSGKSLVKKGSIPICQKEERRPLLLTFGGKGNKVIVWNGEDTKMQQGLQFVPLDLTAEDRSSLAKAYGR